MNPLSRAATTTATVGMVAMVGACVDGPTLPDLSSCGQIYGTYEGNAFGAMTDTVTGCAYYTVSVVSGTFAMVLTNGGPLSDNPMLKVLSTSLPLGTRVVGPDAGQLYGVVFLGDRTFTLSSGTVTSAPGAGEWGRKTLVGTVDVIATDDGGETIRMTGEFRSGCVGATDLGTPGTDRERPVPPECAVTGSALRAARAVTQR